MIEAVDELLEIARLAGVRAEIYHLKASGQANWPKIDQAIAMVEAARAEGHRVTADAYPYTFSGTGLDACIPPWAHEGGFDALLDRLRDPVTRARILEGMRSSSSEWENPFVETEPDAIVVTGFRQDALRDLTGKTLAEVASLRGTTPEETVADLLLEDDNNVGALYFAMSEDDVRKVLSLPWVSFCSALASSSRSSTIRFIRSSSSVTKATVSWRSSGSAPISSRWPRMIVIGVRSSCPASSTNARWAAKSYARRSSISLN